MKHAIIGAGAIGTALARVFERTNVEVSIANSRGPETLAALARELGPNVSPCSVQDAVKADVIFLAVPFPTHGSVAGLLPDWSGKIVVDTTNTLDLSPAVRRELGSDYSSEVVARAFRGARLVKAFNHLPARHLGTNPPVAGQRQAVFIASDDTGASASVATLVEQLGFAPVELGSLARGGAPLHVVDGQPDGLLFQNLVKLD